MRSSQAIFEFQSSCHKYFVTYVFSVNGISNFANELARFPQDRNDKLAVGTGHPNEGHWHAEIGIGEVIESSKPNGAFSDKIAKSFIVTIYSEWDEDYRHRVAAELGVIYKNVRCDLMGDLRLIRHCIVHGKSIIGDEHRKLKVLKWQLSPGVLVITGDMFTLLMDQINRMIVKAESDSSANSTLELTGIAPEHLD